MNYITTEGRLSKRLFITREIIEDGIPMIFYLAKQLYPDVELRAIDHDALWEKLQETERNKEYFFYLTFHNSVTEYRL